jgi:hypothetical protein
LEAKLLLFTILSSFIIEKSSKTPENLTLAKGNTGFIGNIYVNFKLRK